MSFGKAERATESPAAANVQPEDASTNEQAVPVAWWIGPDWRPLTWIVPEVYNIETREIRSKVGKGSSTVTGHDVWGDVAGIAGLGIIRAVRELEIAGTVVWTGNIVRPTSPAHPDYWRATIITDQVKCYVYWGRPDQPVDDILLSTLGASLAHPAYRNQVLVILKRCYFGSTANSVPNVRLRLDREPKPTLGTFAALASAQGESIVAGALELATSPIFGGALPAERFTAAEWEALSAAVVASVGCHAPMLDRAQPLRDVLNDFAEYYDGFYRLEGGKVRPGRFPHNGAIPSGLTELSSHDFVTPPDIEVKTPSASMNDITVMCRDGADKLRKKPVSGSDSASVEARRAHDSKTVDMLGIIDLNQAAVFANEAAATGAELQMEGEINVRRSRARWSDASRLQAGDNFNLDHLQLELDQVSRITKRTDPYRGSPLLEFVAERGVWPTPYTPPGDLRPEAGAVYPDEITSARLLELTPALAGTPHGLPIAILARRPKSSYAAYGLTAASVQGFRAWDSPDNATYDALGDQTHWASDGTLREAIANASADVVVKIAFHALNLDLSRLTAQSPEAQINDVLLIVVGEEIFSVGAVTIAALNYDFSCKRVRQGSLPAAHALGAAAWIFYRDELNVFKHGGFVEDSTRWFKLQPYTQSAFLELADADPFSYHFRDRAPEAPYIEIDDLTGTLYALAAYLVTGEITDINGDLTTFEVLAQRLSGTGGAVVDEFTIRSGDVSPDNRGGFTFSAPFTFPVAGIWRLQARAFDVTEAYTETTSAEHTVGTAIVGAFNDFRFKRAATIPATPTGDDPSGWDDAPHADDGNPEWMIFGAKNSAGNLLGVWSTPIRITGMNGTSGVDGGFVDYVFKRNATLPATPTGNGTPAGWSDAPPAGSTPLWMSVGVKTASDVLVGVWSTPVQMNGENGNDGLDGDDVIIEYSVTGAASWHSVYAGGDMYMRQKVGVGGTFSAAIKIVGEDGNDGADGGFVDYVFKRNPTAPATPTGNGTPAGWSDAPPVGSDPLWTSVAVKTAADVLVGVWSTPVQLNGSAGLAGLDGDDVIVEYSITGSSSWHSTFTAGDKYMRQKIGVGGAFSAAIKIVGEDGADGLDANFIDHVFKRNPTAPATPTGNGTPAGWSDAPPVGSDPLWYSVGEKTPADVLVGVWSTPVRLNGADGGSGLDGDDIFVEYSITGASSWHSTFAVGDFFMRTKVGAGGTWSLAIRIVGEDGADGLDGDSVQVEYSIDGATSWHFPFATGDKYMRQRVGSGAWSAAVKMVGENGTNGGSILGSVSGGGSGSGNAYTSISPPLTLTVTCDGLPRRIEITGGSISNASGTNPATVNAALFMDGTQIGEYVSGGVSLANGATTPMAFAAYATPTAGSHTFELKGKNASNVGWATGGVLGVF